MLRDDENEVPRPRKVELQHEWKLPKAVEALRSSHVGHEPAVLALARVVMEVLS